MIDHAAAIAAVLDELAPDWPRDRPLFDPVGATKPSGTKTRIGKARYVVTIPRNVDPQPVGFGVMKALGLGCKGVKLWGPSSRDDRAIVIWEFDGTMSPVRFGRIEDAKRVKSIERIVDDFGVRVCPRGFRDAAARSWK